MQASNAQPGALQKLSLEPRMAPNTATSGSPGPGWACQRSAHAGVVPGSMHPDPADPARPGHQHCSASAHAGVVRAPSSCHAPHGPCCHINNAAL